MKSITNARTINKGGNMTIINGRVISGGCYSAEAKKIDETKSVGAEGINRIKVDSGLADVTIAVGSKTDVEVHYYGEVCTDGKLKFDVTTSGDEVNVSAKINGSTFNGSLKLDVLIPQKVFRLISVKCQNGSTELCNNVAAERIRINLQNGSIESEASFEEITAKSMNGFARNRHNSTGKYNATGDVSSMNGNVRVQ